MFRQNGEIYLRDIAAESNKDGSHNADMIDLVSKSDPLIGMLPVKEANDGTSNRTDYVVALPTADFVGYREGVKPSKSGVTYVRNTAAHLESKLKISQREWDKAKKVNDGSAFLLSQVQRHITAMRKKMSHELFYGSIAANPRGFNGLMAHQNGYSTTLGSATMGTYDDMKPEYYLINGGGTLSVTNDGGEDKVHGAGTVTAQKASEISAENKNIRSIGFIGLGNNSVCGFYPEGSVSGCQKGVFKEHVDVLDGKGGEYEGCSQTLSWDLGLDIPDWRFITWLRNLDLTTMLLRGAEQSFIECFKRMHTRAGGGERQGARFVWTMSNPVWENVQTIYSRLTMANACSFEDVDGIKMPTLLGDPVLIEDVMNTSEEVLPSAVSGM